MDIDKKERLTGVQKSTADIGMATSQMLTVVKNLEQRYDRSDDILLKLVRQVERMV